MDQSLAHKVTTNSTGGWKTVPMCLSQIRSTAGSSPRTTTLSVVHQDIGDNLEASTIRLFADERLLYQTVKNDSDATSLQSDLDQLMSWANRWQMRFNTSKCSILRVSRKKQQIIHPYTMMGVKLAQVKHHPYL